LLIVEDNDDLRSFMSTGLYDDYRVLEADNGITGLHMAKSYAPDLIISDIMMPEMDGLELCTSLKENLLTSHIPVILLTARSTVENWIEGLETGADDYIPKPFNFALLKARITNLIENRKKLRRIFSREINVDPRQITTSTADQQFLHKALKIVEENYTNSEFGVEDFIEKIGVSRSLLHKKLTAITELSAGDFITSIRLKKSIELLKIQTDNISEIAYNVGFNDPKYFSRIFKKNFGMSPKDYKDSASELNTSANS
jgi:Response regulators consisting of a CheY-like receiver domain and a winged-helix DNA-binding domain